MTPVSPPIIRIKPPDSKRFKKFFQLEKNIIFAITQYISQHFSSVVIYGMPQPSLMGFFADITPHLIQLGIISNSLNINNNLVCVYLLQ